MDRIRFSSPKRFLLVSTYLSCAVHVAANCQVRDELTARADTPAWNESSWGSLQPSKDLNWVPCYPDSGRFECTRLQVPLDYDNPDDGRTAAIALLRVPANVSSDSPDYRGPVLFNPGGPGNSAVDLILSRGPRFSQTLGPQFDIVGFDPRGKCIQRSTPRIEFYQTPAERTLKQFNQRELNNSLRDTVQSYWGNAKVMGALAYERGKDYLPFMNTDHVARDMLSITQAHGREKVQFWGFSYGAILGYTFASMFPDKVERMILDGVMDVEDYYGTKWLTGLESADKTLEWFFKSCHEAGPDACVFHADSPEAIRNRVERVYANIIESPIVVPAQANWTSSLVHYGVVRPLVLLPFLYTPGQWPALAELLKMLEERNITGLAPAFGQLPIECESTNAFEPNSEAFFAFLCNDGDPVPADLEAAESHYKESVEYSSFGSYWSSTRIACSGWPQDIPKAKFRGPIAGNTSFPLLLIGNTADPVTPLSAAKRVSQNFPGSVVLTQDSPGHASIAAPSNCTSKVIREYFANGSLPEEGTVCAMDGSFFAPTGTADSETGIL
ncbi:hypothetical protein V5O48_001142 [Marasmius crinis-equi]|uniref:Alpha/beta-hydrolase n=1 Tax=Marasmius crinis-equi TaxID=585013 RepID=A0ABR3FZP7_9AGAR